MAKKNGIDRMAVLQYFLEAPKAEAEQTLALGRTAVSTRKEDGSVMVPSLAPRQKPGPKPGFRRGLPKTESAEKVSV